MFLVMVIAYLISDFSIKNVFLAQSPKFNPFFVTNTIAKVNSFWSRTGNLIASINFFPKFNFQNAPNTADDKLNTSQPNSFSLSEAQINNILEAPLKKVSKGVYAGEKDGYQVYKIDTDELGYITYTFIVNGKEIKVKVPSGQQPPSQQDVEAVYR